MSRLAILLTVFGLAFGATSVAVAYTPLGDAVSPKSAVVFGQDECKEGETWNEESKQCEKEES